MHSQCPDIEQLTDYAEGLLGLVEKRQVRKHLRSCASCAETVAPLWLLFSSLRNAHRHPACGAWRYLRGKMGDGREKTAYQRHLERCVRCSLWVSALRIFGRDAPPSPAVHVRPRDFWLFGMRLVPVVAAAAAVIAVLIPSPRPYIPKGYKLVPIQTPSLEHIFGDVSERSQLDALIADFEEARLADTTGALDRDAAFHLKLSDLYRRRYTVTRDPLDREHARTEEKKGIELLLQSGARKNVTP